MARAIDNREKLIFGPRPTGVQRKNKTNGDLK